MLVAQGVERRAFARRQFVWRAIASAVFEKGERAVIHDEVIAEKFLRHTKAFREQSPEPFAADFAAMAIESGDEPFRMLIRRALDLHFDAEPIADGGDLAERDAGLGHAERAGIHSEKQDALRTVAIASEIDFVGAPRVAKRIVNMRYRSRERQRVDPIARSSSGRDQVSRHTSISNDRCNGCRSRRAARFR